jgi:hypothetical protein
MLFVYPPSDLFCICVCAPISLCGAKLQFHPLSLERYARNCAKLLGGPGDARAARPRRGAIYFSVCKVGGVL